MLMVMPDEGKLAAADLIFRGTGSEDYKLDLFKNNYTIIDTTTWTDLVVANFTGYNQISITRASFSTAIISAGVAVSARAVAPVFTCTGGAAQTVYGWALRGVTSGSIWFAANFDTPRVMGPGATETLDPFQFKGKTFA